MGLLLQNSTLDFCVESFIPESDRLRIPTYDESIERFRFGENRKCKRTVQKRTFLTVEKNVLLSVLKD
jgi:hypothetical protein